MKILLVTDGTYPEHINGVSIYIRYLAEELVQFGHDVSIFHHVRSGLFKEPAIEQSCSDGIRYYGVINSPISFSEGLVHPLTSCRERKTERLFARVLEHVQPDVVHFHEFERTPSSCIEIAKARHISVLVTLHDYWLICPRLQLFTLDEKVCEGPGEGRNCAVRCLAGDLLTRQYRRITMLLPDGPVLDTIKGLRNMYKKARGENLGQTGSCRPVRENSKGTQDARLVETFRMREALNRASLSKADHILAVSTCVRDIFKEHGIDREKIIVHQLGVKSADWVKRRLRRLDSYPLRFGFLGHLGPTKGARIILKAARMVSPERAAFLFYGGADAETLHDFKRQMKNLRHCTYAGRYEYRRLEGVFNSFDVLIIPSLWQETLGMIGLEAQAAGVPVVSSDIGGMKDYIMHGKNGLFFSPGDAEELARILNSMVRQPYQIEEMSGRAIRPKSMEEDCKATISLYAQVIAQVRRRKKP